jgi:DNA-binding NarL/FixJ family response regulator
MTENTFNQEMITMCKKIRVLIVDDSASFRMGMRALLEIQPDMEVAGESTSGNKALKSLEEQQPDIVLLDAKMPGLSGVEVTRQIKDRWPQVKVILMTMFADYCSKSINAGADAFLTKGIPPEDVLSVIRGVGHPGNPERQVI